MLPYATVGWVKLLAFLLPVIWAGIVTFRRVSSERRIELILPAGAVLGVALLVFLLNLIAYVAKGTLGVFLAYGATIFIGVLLFRKKRSDKVNFPKGKSLLFFLTSLLVWGAFIFWKSAHAPIGSDRELYYAVASTFLRGNFPPVTPWQPDVLLSYHIGPSLLLGAFQLFTGLSFEFLHLFFSAFFILSSALIVIWIWKRHTSILSFSLANLAAGIAFISFGFLKFAWPVFPLELPQVSSFREFVLWGRQLPTVNESIEVYGAPINLDALIYFIFHAFGIAIFVCALVLLLNPKKVNVLLTWATIFVMLAALAIVSESLFVGAAPALILGILYLEWRKKTLRKNLFALGLLLILFFLTAVLQGGVITSGVFPPEDIPSSVALFPKEGDIREDFTSYHYYQEITKSLPTKNDWLPFRWYHVGLDALLPIAFFLVLLLRKREKWLFLLGALSLTGLFSLIAYNVIVPKYLIANGNRFLAHSYQFSALALSLSVIGIISLLQKEKHKFTKFLVLAVFFWVALPTVIPPLALLSKTRFGPNKLAPISAKTSEAFFWIKENLPADRRVVVLDSRAPHPSGMARVMAEAGVFAPVFPGEFRAYTIEPSPEYTDIVYSLSPKALEKLGVSIFYLESSFYESLPKLRQKQLLEENYFKVLFEKKHNGSWERIFEIKDSYLAEGGELPGTLEELAALAPKEGSFYIDNEENFDPSFLRRPLIFVLRGRDLYFEPGSGIYLNVEEEIPFKHPSTEANYDYLALSPKTRPEDICGCETRLLWQGLEGQLLLWENISKR